MGCYVRKFKFERGTFLAPKPCRTSPPATPNHHPLQRRTLMDPLRSAERRESASASLIKCYLSRHLMLNIWMQIKAPRLKARCGNVTQTTSQEKRMGESNAPS